MNLKDCIKKYYMKTGDFTLSSGKKSNLYFDMKGLMLDSYITLPVFQKFFIMVNKNLIKENIFIDYGFAGMELGGAQIVQYMVALGNKGIIVRKQAKDYGLGGRIIQSDSPPKNVFIVDDVITSGKTVEEVKSLLAPTHNILGIYCIIDRTEDKRYNSLFKESDFL